MSDKLLWVWGGTLFDSRILIIEITIVKIVLLIVRTQLITPSANCIDMLIYCMHKAKLAPTMEAESAKFRSNCYTESLNSITFFFMGDYVPKHSMNSKGSVTQMWLHLSLLFTDLMNLLKISKKHMFLIQSLIQMMEWIQRVAKYNAKESENSSPKQLFFSR